MRKTDNCSTSCNSSNSISFISVVEFKQTVESVVVYIVNIVLTRRNSNQLLSFSRSELEAGV